MKSSPHTEADCNGNGSKATLRKEPQKDTKLRSLLAEIQKTLREADGVVKRLRAHIKQISELL